jgi:hypothetical protein
LEYLNGAVLARPEATPMPLPPLGRVLGVVGSALLVTSECVFSLVSSEVVFRPARGGIATSASCPVTDLLLVLTTEGELYKLVEYGGVVSVTLAHPSLPHFTALAVVARRDTVRVQLAMVEGDVLNVRDLILGEVLVSDSTLEVRGIAPLSQVLYCPALDLLLVGTLEGQVTVLGPGGEGLGTFAVGHDSVALALLEQGEGYVEVLCSSDTLAVLHIGPGGAKLTKLPLGVRVISASVSLGRRVACAVRCPTEDRVIHIQVPPLSPSSYASFVHPLPYHVKEMVLHEDILYLLCREGGGGSWDSTDGCWLVRAIRVDPALLGSYSVDSAFTELGYIKLRGDGTCPSCLALLRCEGVGVVLSVGTSEPSPSSGRLLLFKVVVVEGQGVRFEPWLHRQLQDPVRGLYPLEGGGRFLVVTGGVCNTLALLALVKDGPWALKVLASKKNPYPLTNVCQFDAHEDYVYCVTVDQVDGLQLLLVRAKGEGQVELQYLGPQGRVPPSEITCAVVVGPGRVMTVTSCGELTLHSVADKTAVGGSFAEALSPFKTLSSVKVPGLMTTVALASEGIVYLPLTSGGLVRVGL